MDYVRNLLFSRAIGGSRVVLEADKEYRSRVLTELARSLLLAGHTPIYIELGRVTARTSFKKYLDWWWREGYRLVAPRNSWGSSFGENPTIAIVDDFENYIEYPSIYGPVVEPVWSRAYVIGLEPGYSGDLDAVVIPGTRGRLGALRRVPTLVLSLVGVSRDVELVVV